MSPFSVEFAKEAFAELEGLAKPIVRCPAILAGFVALATLQPPVPVAAGEENLACPMGREYFLSTPDGIATGPEAAARTAFLAQSVAGPSARIETAALGRIDALVAERPADAAARLASMAG